MTARVVRVSPDWLALREPADAAARSRDFADVLARWRPLPGCRLIHDLGGGTGSMGRWLAPQLPGPQHWVIHDRDHDLLQLAAAQPPGRSADGQAVTVETRRSDIIRLNPEELVGAHLVTASALLDMLTAAELAAVVAVCLAPRCPVLLTLSVVGRVTLTPADPLDGRVAAAFNDHQRRDSGRGRLLGPDAVAAAGRAFGDAGAEVLFRDSPWRLGARESALAAEWLRGWVGAAVEQDAGLAAEADDYRGRRLGQLAAGELRITVGHADLLVLPAHSVSKRDESA
jgi:hypothetical protein